MSDVYLVKEKMHKMRAKLYPSYLPGTEGKYIARTSNEATVGINQPLGIFCGQGWIIRKLIAVIVTLFVIG